MNEKYEERKLYDGVQRTFKFDNGYGASVVQHSGSYGGPAGLWELAVLGRSGRLTYETPITDDVIGRLTWNEVMEIVAKIAALPDAPPVTED